MEPTPGWSVRSATSLLTKVWPPPARAAILSRRGSPSGQQSSRRPGRRRSPPRSPRAPADPSLGVRCTKSSTAITALAACPGTAASPRLRAISRAPRRGSVTPPPDGRGRPPSAPRPDRRAPPSAPCSRRGPRTRTPADTRALIPAHLLEDGLDPLHRVLGPAPLLLPSVERQDQLLLHRRRFTPNWFASSTACMRLIPCWRNAPTM